LEHFCDYYPGQILIQNPEGDPVTDLGLVPVVPEDLFLIGEPGDGEVALMEDVLAFYESRGVFAYKLDVANPTEDQLFDAIIAARDASEGASPHYLLKPAGTWKYGPYDTATNVPGTWQFGDLESTGPGPNDGRLVIIDTGGNGPDTDIGVASSEPERPGEDPRVVGHGTFAASIALQYNPGLSVEIYRASLEDGTMSEATVTGALFRAFDVPPNQETAVIPAGTVVNLSLGTYPCGPDFQPLGLSLSMSNQVVAASGNDGSGHVPDQLYPASHPDVVGVSSLTTGWMNASWANRGEVYAPGEHVVGWYHDGTDGGLAAWSGTSFAAPHRAACIASGYC
jgi:hypothetical protein